MNIKEFATNRKDLYFVPLKHLALDEGFNVRDNLGDIDALAQSIAENGVRVPLRVRSGEDALIIVDGHRRFEAAKIAVKKYHADIKGVPVLMETKGTNDGERIFDLLICNDGKPLEALEEGKAFKRLLDMGYKQKDIASKIGKSIAFVSGRLDLFSADPSVREAVEKGNLAPTTATKLSKKSPEEQQAKAEESKSRKVKGNEVDGVRRLSNKRVKAAVDLCLKKVSELGVSADGYLAGFAAGLRYSLGEGSIPVEEEKKPEEPTK